jgi:hypothetical protein
MLQGIAAEHGGMADDDFPMMLDMESEDRFLDLYAHLLVYVNDRFDVVEDVETVDDISERDTGELLPLRERLYEEDTASIIEAFVDESSADQSVPTRNGNRSTGNSSGSSSGTTERTSSRCTSTMTTSKKRSPN